MSDDVADMAVDQPTQEIPAVRESLGVQAASSRRGTLSTLGAVRDRYRASERDEWEDFDLPGFGGELKARYRVIDFERAQEIERAALAERPHAWRQVNVQVDELIEACECLVTRDPGTGDFAPLTDDGGRLVGLGDERIAAEFGIDYAQTPRDVVIGLFTHANGRKRAPILISRHFEEYAAWVEDARRGAAQRFAGE